VRGALWADKYSAEEGDEKEEEEEGGRSTKE